MNDQKAKHTPGPWTYKKTASLGPDYAVYPEVSGGTVAIVYTGETAEANAALISAAPDMMKTLEAVLDWWTHTPDFENGEDDMPAEIFDGIRNAINKAKGY